MPPIRSAVFDRLRKPYERPASEPRGRSNRNWEHDRAPEEADASNRLEIKNLHWEVTEQELSTIFSTIGTLASKPHIRFDRSGRSTGIAYVEYTTPAEAISAKKQLDGKVAKSQAMAITFAAPRIPPGVKAAAKSDSLVNRIAKPPLLSRISSGKSNVKKRTATANGGPARKRRPPPVPKEKTAEELDKELDAFMGTPVGGKETTVLNGDVEMS